MAICLHGFISSAKRYVQVESQPHHLTSIFRKIMRSNKLPYRKFNKVHAYEQCEEDGTITFYQADNIDVNNSGIWTYLVYECPEGEEYVFRDSSIDISTKPLEELFCGRKLVQVAVDINEYLECQCNQDEYLDVLLPLNWHYSEGREIANLLLEEFKAFKSSSVFAEGVGKEYMQVVLDGFIQAAREVMDNGGSLKDFESAQYDLLHKVKIDELANFILEYNDYRIWLSALPSKSKAVEHAFNTALNLICR